MSTETCSVMLDTLRVYYGGNEQLKDAIRNWRSERNWPPMMDAVEALYNSQLKETCYENR